MANWQGSRHPHSLAGCPVAVVRVLEVGCSGTLTGCISLCVVCMQICRTTVHGNPQIDNLATEVISILPPPTILLGWLHHIPPSAPIPHLELLFPLPSRNERGSRILEPQI